MVNLQTETRPNQPRNTALDQQMSKIEQAVNALSTAQPPARRLVVANTSVLPTDQYLFVDASGGAVTVNLPTATVQQQVSVAKTDASVLAVVVVPFGAQTINGAASFTLAAQYDTVSLMSDGGSNWIVFG